MDGSGAFAAAGSKCAAIPRRQVHFGAAAHYFVRLRVVFGQTRSKEVPLRKPRNYSRAHGSLRGQKALALSAVGNLGVSGWLALAAVMLGLAVLAAPPHAMAGEFRWLAWLGLAASPLWMLISQRHCPMCS